MAAAVAVRAQPTNATYGLLCPSPRAPCSHSSHASLLFQQHSDSPATSAPGLGSLLPHLTLGSLAYVHGPGADVGGDEASPGADVAGPSPKMWHGCAHSRTIGPYQRAIGARLCTAASASCACCPRRRGPTPSCNAPAYARLVECGHSCRSGVRP